MCCVDRLLLTVNLLNNKEFEPSSSWNGEKTYEYKELSSGWIGQAKITPLIQLAFDF
jgi:hypothetical protein